jgi:hypothetical protein
MKAIKFDPPKSELPENAMRLDFSPEFMKKHEAALAIVKRLLAQGEEISNPHGKSWEFKGVVPNADLCTVNKMIREKHFNADELCLQWLGANNGVTSLHTITVYDRAVRGGTRLEIKYTIQDPGQCNIDFLYTYFN